MKLIVDEKPSDWSKCPFAEKNQIDIFYAQCRLSGVSCGLDRDNYCDRLLSIWEVIRK